MTIRRTLLIAFLGVGLISAILLASLAFVKARQALRLEIERNMAVEAASVSADIDKMMFERIQNAVVWSRLDTMQDMQVRDVDKRLSQFLASVKDGYRDVYVSLSCADPSGMVIASSDAGAVGRAEVSANEWLTTRLSGTDLRLNLDQADGSIGISIDVLIASAFAERGLGHLRLRLNWNEIHSVLDRASDEDGRLLVLLDKAGAVISASSSLRKDGLLLSKNLASWRKFAGTVELRSGEPLLDAEVIVGGASAKGYAQFSGFGWTTLVIQPADRAFAPIHGMALIFVGLIGLIAIFTLMIGTLVSHAIARPVVALTAAARHYMRTRVLQVRPIVGGSEVGELAHAFVQMVRDIDLSKQKLVRASKLAVVGEMAAVIAHEVRTPLGILRSSAQMLQRESGISNEGLELVGFIESETERLNRLVSAMLDTARPRTPTFVEVDVHALIRQTIAMLSGQAESKAVRVKTDLRAVNAVVSCDSEQITQVVLNLLINGLQILQRGCTIEVSTHDDEDDLHIEIADDGPGIDPTERERVFEAFFFKREGGIGLGLAIVQQIVASHSGEIETSDSKLGGAMFHIRLPRTRETPV